MKSFKKFLYSICALLISGGFLYADILFAFPSEITMHTNEVHKSSLGALVNIGDIPKEICASANQNKVTPIQQGEYSATLKIANTIPFKKIKLRVTSPRSVYASGELIGLRLHNKGLIVTQSAPIKTAESSISPAENAGIVPGDVILEINGTPVRASEEVGTLLSESTTLTLLRNNSIKKVTVNPVRDETDARLKLGVWVRDSTAGVGTMTYFDAQGGSYGALGHGISDSDTGVMFDVESGTIEKSRVVSVKKGQHGTPGEICGSFSYEKNVTGTVYKNCESGIFGSVFPENSLCGTLFPIGVMSQVEVGSAYILSTVDECIRQYNIEILRTMPFGSAAKGLMIKITDPSLLQKTGGIIQGMSGSPIIQNGKLIGAVTHVLVNDPTRGYGIFIENMLKEAGE